MSLRFDQRIQKVRRHGVVNCPGRLDSRLPGEDPAPLE